MGFTRVIENTRKRIVRKNKIDNDLSGTTFPLGKEDFEACLKEIFFIVNGKKC